MRSRRPAFRPVHCDWASMLRSLYLVARMMTGRRGGGKAEKAVWGRLAPRPRMGAPHPAVQGAHLDRTAPALADQGLDVAEHDGRARAAVGGGQADGLLALAAPGHDRRGEDQPGMTGDVALNLLEGPAVDAHCVAAELHADIDR